MFCQTAVLSHAVLIPLAVWILHNKKSSMLGINKDLLTLLAQNRQALLLLLQFNSQSAAANRVLPSN